MLRRSHTALLTIPLLVVALAGAPEIAQAQSYADYCHDRAQRLSGYSGRPGNVVEGAARGAIGAAIITGILGGDRGDRRDAAKLGAVIGGISNANRSNGRAARIYRLEFNACMRQR